MRGDVDCGHLCIGDFDACRITGGIDLAFDVEAGARRGCRDQLYDGLITDQRLTPQFCVMNENSLCSILFHLLVPGVK
jgi:hypothetical protein